MLWQIDPAATTSLHDQITGGIRRAVAEGELGIGERLPPARDLAEALRVDPNTVLAAYRRLRTEGVLEFRRGRGVRVSETAVQQAAVRQAAQALVTTGREHGYGRADLIRLIEELT